MLTRLHKDLARSSSGTAFIEAAVLLPVILGVMGGIFDFGRAYATMAAAQKSLRGAVRYLTLLPSGAVCSWGATNARNIAVYGNFSGSGSPVVTGWTVDDVTLVSPTTCAYATPVGKIKMSADVPYTSLMWNIVGLPSTITMSVEYEERWVGQ